MVQHKTRTQGGIMGRDASRAEGLIGAAVQTRTRTPTAKPTDNTQTTGESRAMRERMLRADLRGVLQGLEESGLQLRQEGLQELARLGDQQPGGNTHIGDEMRSHADINTKEGTHKATHPPPIKHEWRVRNIPERVENGSLDGGREAVAQDANQRTRDLQHRGNAKD